MNHVFKNEKTIEFKTILLSLFFHFLVIEFCIVIFPLKDVLNNPSFIFLGPILENQDFLLRQAASPRIRSAQTAMPLTEQSPKGAFNMQDLSAVKKPSFTSPVEKKQKEFTKSFFPNEIEEREGTQLTTEEFADKWGINLKGININL